ncbi:acetyltransferase [Podospora fimiseda]|uniref:Acetyltransferase n=1 Tax=Podospora fimiseda TaxID=252190 RepID=A0AAN7GVV0_9PEZI|nr:acetyltransferase [Podospora fimiseda]
MPAILDDPAATTIYRVSGEPPYPDPAHPSLPPTILPRHVTLRDRQTVATVIPFASRHEVPESLLRYLSDQFSKEIEGGDTYPMMEPMSFDKFAAYWFQNFGGIMLLGHIESAAEVVEGKDWSKECLGTFYIKPNYPGRSSHICNAGFIVTDASRNRGVGRLMGETYLEWAPKLGYTYSVFNLVYETNVASCKIWDGLGFKRIGRVKGAGNLKSHPDQLVDAIIYGRDLGDSPGNEELVSEERFDKIKFYLKYGRYPNGADRAEKSRLRSAATHYKLLEGDVLMLKDKEVISDPQRQYEIARGVHNQAHAGINKTTATIAERYHWSRIKETVSDVIRNCSECKELGKASSSQSQPQSQSQSQQPSPSIIAVPPINGVKRPNINATSGAPSSKRSSPSPSGSAMDVSQRLSVPPPPPPIPDTSSSSHLAQFTVPSHHQFTDPTAISLLSPTSPIHHHHPEGDVTTTSHESIIINHHNDTHHNPMLQDAPHSHHHHHHHHHPPIVLPDPHSSSVYQPIDPQIISQSIHLHHHHHHHYPFDDHHHDSDFQALINAAGGDPGVGVVGVEETEEVVPVVVEREEDEAERAAVDRDLEMLIEQPRDDDEVEIEPEKEEEACSSLSSGVRMDIDAAVSAAAENVGGEIKKMSGNHLTSLAGETPNNDEQDDGMSCMRS